MRFQYYFILLYYKQLFPFFRTQLIINTALQHLEYLPSSNKKIIFDYAKKTAQKIKMKMPEFVMKEILPENETSATKNHSLIKNVEVEDEFEED